MKYARRETEIHSVDAIQFLGPDSVQDIQDQFGIRVKYYPDTATLYLPDGTAVERGDYVVSTGFIVVGRVAEWFESRFRPNQKQHELFTEKEVI